MVEANPDFSLEGARKPSHPDEELVLTEDMAVVFKDKEGNDKPF